MRRVPFAGMVVLVALGAALAGCASFTAPDEPGLYAEKGDDFQRLNGDEKWSRKSWTERSNLAADTRFVVVHPALSHDPAPIEEKVKLRRVGWLRSEIGSDGEIGPVTGSQWVAPDLPGLDVPLDYDYVDGRPDVVRAAPRQRLEPGLYSLQMSTNGYSVGGRLGVDWSSVDRQRYATAQCIDRYHDGDQTYYRPCAEQELVTRTRGLRLYLVEPDEQMVDGSSVIVVKGVVVNVSDTQQHVPMLEGQLRDRNGETIHTWRFTPPQGDVEPGQSVSFRSVVNEVPKGVSKVTVSFSPTYAYGQQQIY